MNRICEIFHLWVCNFQKNIYHSILDHSVTEYELFSIILEFELEMYKVFFHPESFSLHELH